MVIFSALFARLGRQLGRVANVLSGWATPLRSPGGRFQIILYPSDLMIRGEKERVERTSATLTREIIFTDAYMTWSKGANAVEDEIRAFWTRFTVTGGCTTL